MDRLEQLLKEKEQAAIAAVKRDAEIDRLRAQRAEALLKSMVGMRQAPIGNVRGAKRAAAKGGVLKPLFKIPDGTTWAGRGMVPKNFVAWARTQEGRKWRTENPGMLWPVHPGSKAEVERWMQRTPRKAARKSARRALAGKSRKAK